MNLQEQKEAVAGQPPAPGDEPAIDVKNLSKVAYTTRGGKIVYQE
jgi:hypothetical protein